MARRLGLLGRAMEKKKEKGMMIDLLGFLIQPSTEPGEVKFHAGVLFQEYLLELVDVVKASWNSVFNRDSLPIFHVSSPVRASSPNTSNERWFKSLIVKKPLWQALTYIYGGCI